MGEKRIRQYKKKLSKSGGFDKLPTCAQDAIFAWNRLGKPRKKKKRK